MEPRTFIEMTENLRHMEGRFPEISLVGPEGKARLTYSRVSGTYVLHVYLVPDDVYKGLYCRFIRVETEGPDRVCLIYEDGDGIYTTVFDPTRFEFGERESSHGIVRGSTTVEQKEEATNGRR